MNIFFKIAKEVLVFLEGSLPQPDSLVANQSQIYRYVVKIKYSLHFQQNSEASFDVVATETNHHL